MGEYTSQDIEIAALKQSIDGIQGDIGDIKDEIKTVRKMLIGNGRTDKSLIARVRASEDTLKLLLRVGVPILTGIAVGGLAHSVWG